MIEMQLGFTTLHVIARSVATKHYKGSNVHEAGVSACFLSISKILFSRKVLGRKVLRALMVALVSARIAVQK